jgi:hypothetical protein
VLTSLLGADTRLPQARPVRRRVGRGTVYWTPASLGMDYYRKAADRPSLLPELRRLVGADDVLSADGLPATVGAFAWQGAAGGTRFVDLVNYDFNGAGEQLRPARALELRVSLPSGWRSVQARTLSPDGDPAAQVELSGGWATIHLPRLTHFASVRLARGDAGR